MKNKIRYEMTLIWYGGYTKHFSFWSTEVIENGKHNKYLYQIMNDWLEEHGYTIFDPLPYDYTVDTYEDWCLIQSHLEQEEMRKGAEDTEWGCFPY